MELVAHYEALERKAEKRKWRAEWREARWRLAGRRREWMERENWETGETGEEGERGEGSLLMAEKVTFSDDVVIEEVAMVNTDSKLAAERQDADSSSPLTFVPAENLSSDGVVDEPSTSLPETRSLLPFKSPPSLVEVHNEQGSANLPPAVPVVTRGQAPPSTIGDLIHYGRGVADQTHFPSTVQTQQNVLSSRGQAPPTTIQNLLYPPSTIGDLIHYGGGVADQTHFSSTIQTQQNVLSSRGQAPPTTIQNLLYHLTSDKATPPEPYETTPTIGEFPCAPPQPYTLSYPQLG